jgi:hypothetical protein
MFFEAGAGGGIGGALGILLFVFLAVISLLTLLE